MLSQERMVRSSVPGHLVENVFCSGWKPVQAERTCSTTWYADTSSQTCSPDWGLLQSGEELPEAQRPSVDDVAQDGELAIIAGSDTTSSVLTALLYYLLRNPEVYNRLQEEVDSALISGEEPLDAVKLSHMVWLNGCMCVTTHRINLNKLIFVILSNSNEALRLQPPVPSGSQRSVNKGKGVKVLGNL